MAYRYIYEGSRNAEDGRPRSRRLEGGVDRLHRGWKAYLDVEQCANARAEKELRALFRRMVAVFAFARLI